MFWKLKVNWKNFQQIFFKNAIHFTSSHSGALKCLKEHERFLYFLFVDERFSEKHFVSHLHMIRPLMYLREIIQVVVP